MARTRIAGHRGASGLVEHENTLEAFAKTAEVGAGWIELDVRRLHDGILAVLHDPELDGHPVGELTLPAVREISERLGYRVPTLAEALEHAAGKLCVDIELKELGTEDQVVEIARACMRPGTYVYSSFHDDVVRDLRRQDPDAQAGLLLGKPTPENRVRTRVSELYPTRRLRACNASFAAPNRQLLRAGFLRRMRSAGFDVWVWTVNDTKEMRRLLKAGVAGIITDRPDLAVQLRDEIQGPEPALDGEATG
jgi:glycerophosphoryl diester phosphodiesterase